MLVLSEATAEKPPPAPSDSLSHDSSAVSVALEAKPVAGLGTRPAGQAVVEGRQQPVCGRDACQDSRSPSARPSPRPQGQTFLNFPQFVS